MKKLISILAVITVTLFLNGCGEETTGEKLDKAIDSTKDATSNALDDVKKALDK